MPETPHASAWTDAANATIAALEAAGTARDWLSANALALTLNDQLQEAPAGADAIALDVFRVAQTAIERLAVAAGEARASAGQDLRLLARGRKAVSAYG